MIGEKSLNIHDNVVFQRKVYQGISSTPFVNLEDGSYTLTAKVKTNSLFKSLEMYAESAGSTQKIEINRVADTWKSIVLENVNVKNGKVEIGFNAEGNPGASAQIDDISLVKNL